MKTLKFNIFLLVSLLLILEATADTAPKGGRGGGRGRGVGGGGGGWEHDKWPYILIAIFILVLVMACGRACSQEEEPRTKECKPKVDINEEQQTR